MEKISIAILILFLIDFNSCVFAASNTIIFTDPNKIITATKTNPIFTITLKSNPTTGYLWKIKNYDTNIITLVDHKFYPSNTNLAGSPGYEIWTFSIKPKQFTLESMNTTISLAYARPWEKQDFQTTIFKILLKYY